MSKKFTSAQRSYRTFKHEALMVIEALMKWEDKLVARKFMIFTDHEALETIKPPTAMASQANSFDGMSTYLDLNTR